MTFPFPFPELPKGLPSGFPSGPPSPKGLPSLSGITGMLVTPENAFQSMVKTALKVDLPPGPQSMLLKLQKGFELGENEFPGLPEFPEFPGFPELPTLPELPKLPGEEPERKAPVPEVRGPPAFLLAKNLTPEYAKKPKTELVRYRLTK